MSGSLHVNPLGQATYEQTKALILLQSDYNSCCTSSCALTDIVVNECVLVHICALLGKQLLCIADECLSLLVVRAVFFDLFEIELTVLVSIGRIEDCRGCAFLVFDLLAGRHGSCSPIAVGIALSHLKSLSRCRQFVRIACPEFFDVDAFQGGDLRLECGNLL